VEVYDVNGPFFFGAAEKFGEYLGQVADRPKAMILDLEGVPVMDSTGLRALTVLVERRTREGVPVVLVGLQGQPRELIARSSLAGVVGGGRLDLTPEEGVALVSQLLQSQGPVRN
jgi:sulfate permease, SulP family